MFLIYNNHFFFFLVLILQLSKLMDLRVSHTLFGLRPTMVRSQRMLISEKKKKRNVLRQRISIEDFQ